jgi:hypothetical protein
LVAFSEPPSGTTWLENAPFVWSHFPSRQVEPLGLKMLRLGWFPACLIPFLWA